MTEPATRLTRRGLLLGGATFAAAPAAAAVDGFLVTPRWLDTSVHAFGAADPLTPTVRVAQLSDLHLRSIGRLHESLLARLHELDPGVIALTGDMIDQPDRLALFDTFLGELPDVPTFAVLGNWEHRVAVPESTYRTLYERHGVELLVDRSVRLTLGTSPDMFRQLLVTGLDDLVEGRPDPATAVADVAACPNHLLLAHCPAARDDCPLPASHAASLVLSGHTHGGQIAPFGRALILPPCSGGYVAGWYLEGGPPLYVSRGIGTSHLPVRIGATPEVAIFDWSLA